MDQSVALDSTIIDDDVYDVLKQGGRIRIVPPKKWPTWEEPILVALCDKDDNFLTWLVT